MITSTVLKLSSVLWVGNGNFYSPLGSLEYNLLNDYLENGGKIYLEGDMPRDSDSDLWTKFGAICPVNALAYIEAIRYDNNGLSMIRQYNQNDLGLPLYSPILIQLRTIFTSNTINPNFLWYI